MQNQQNQISMAEIKLAMGQQALQNAMLIGKLEMEIDRLRMENEKLKEQIEKTNKK